MHAPFRRRRRLRPVLDRFVREGSSPLALAAVVADDRRFGQAVDNNNDGFPSQSVSNFNRVATSSSSLLVSVFVVLLLLPKCPSQARVPPRFRDGVVVLLRRDAAAFVALPILTPNEHAPMSITGIDIVAIAVLPTAVAAAPAVVATIERRRIPSARRRRESSRRRWGPASLHSVALLLLRRRRRHR